MLAARKTNGMKQLRGAGQDVRPGDVFCVRLETAGDGRAGTKLNLQKNGTFPRVPLFDTGVAHDSGEGKRVKIPRGPAAVTGNELRRSHCPSGWEGAERRYEARKPEDLPESE